MTLEKKDISYRKLWILIASRGLEKKYLKDVIGLDQTIYSKLNKDDYVSLKTLVRIANHFNVDLGDIIEIKK